MKNHILNKKIPDYSCLTISDIDLRDWFKFFVDHINFINKPKAGFHGKFFEYYQDRHDIDDCAKFIKDKYGFRDDQFFKMEGFNGVCVYIAIPNNEYLIHDICDDMSDVGYFLNHQQRKTFSNRIELQFEPYHQNIINDKVYEKEYLYHFSPDIYHEEIMTQGLIPRSDNKLFYYPDRIYLSLYYDKELLYNLCSTANKGRHYYVYRIKTKNIPKYIKFYYDAMNHESVFTEQSISCEIIEPYEYGLVSDKSFDVLKSWKE